MIVQCVHIYVYAFCVRLFILVKRKRAKTRSYAMSRLATSRKSQPLCAPICTRLAELTSAARAGESRAPNVHGQIVGRRVHANTFHFFPSHSRSCFVICVAIATSSAIVCTHNPFCAAYNLFARLRSCSSMIMPIYGFIGHSSDARRATYAHTMLSTRLKLVKVCATLSAIVPHLWMICPVR